MKKLVLYMMILATCLANTTFAASIAKSTPSNSSLELVEEAYKRTTERDEAEYKRQQKDIQNRLKSIADRLVSIGDAIKAKHQKAAYAEGKTVAVYDDGIAFEYDNHKGNAYRFKYYPKTKEFVTVKLYFEIDFVADFSRFETSFNQDTVKYISDSYKKYDLKGTLK